MDLRKVKTLIDLVQQSGIAELEIQEGEERVRISRGQTGMATQTHAYAAAPLMMPTPPVAAESVQATVEAAAEPERNVLKSPMVGTFYRAPNPESPNFVNVGDTVKVGQTLCIIEAMKLLNEIESEKDGVIKQILCENGQGVEFDQPLFVIA